VLRAEQVTVNFSGVRAIDEVSIDVDAAQITGLIGPNGAGKTTLFNVITGLRRPDHGAVWLDGRDITGLGARRRASLGMGRTFQRLELFSSLSVEENVLVAAEGQKLHGRRAASAVDAALSRTGLTPLADLGADILSTGNGRLLELARTLVCQPQVLLLDEPFSGLDDAESGRLGDLLVELAGEGMAILLVEHDIEMVMRLCRRIHVLDLGRVIATGSPAEVSADPAVQTAYLGAGAQ
jgi:branched-chain amino acid transport system ATP-binding protein